MASIQERLQMKRVPLDTWSTREQLCLASSVVRSGDQNWMSVSRALKSLGDPSRPADWFSQKNCAIQYGSLLEHVETPKRKKRTADGAAETPQESILKKLTQERISELQKLMTEASHNYAKIKDEVKELLSYDNTPASEVRLRAMGTALETERRGREREAARRAHWLKERDERRALLERAWRRPDAESPHPSPLLTSLLQSPAPLHHVTTPEATSPSSVAPTLSLLLEKSTPPLLTPSDEPPLLTPISKKTTKVSKKSELQLIEKIKSDLVQELEQKFNGGAMPSESNVLGIIPTLHNTSTSAIHNVKDTQNDNPKASVDKGDFYDIEFKQEDVYAFSDIDLDIPPVSSMHKSSLGRALHADKNLFNKRELASNASIDNVASPPPGDSEVLNSLLSLLSPAENLNPETAISTETISEPTQINEIDARPDEAATIPPTVTESENPPQSFESKENISGENQMPSSDIKVENPPQTTGEEEDSDGEMNQKVSDLKKDLEAKKSHENLYLPEGEEGLQKPAEAATLSNVQEPEKPDCKIGIDTAEKQVTTPAQVPVEPNATEGNTEIYDDTPIEVIKEDKPGKTKRDYSRKKTEKDDRAPSPPSEVEGVVSNKSECSDEIGSDNSQGSADKKVLSRRFRNEVCGSRSESPATPLDSLPGSPAPPPTPPLAAHNSSNAHIISTPSNPSPAPTDQEREHRLWKKSIILAYNRLNTLKYASLFHRPITDDQAPGYSEAVRKPIDLSTIRRHIDQGTMRTTAEFQHDVLLMFSNALMYNRTDHRVYTMTQDTMRDACQQLELLLQAQGYATNQSVSTSTSRGARPLRPLVQSVGTAVKRKRGGAAASGDTPASKKRKPDDV